MSSKDAVPLGLRLRRARREAGLSQQELARRAGVSQPLVSYYERSAGVPDGPGLALIGKVIGLDIRADAISEGDRPPPPVARSVLASCRAALLASLERCGLVVALLDEPILPPGGDLAFALDLESHVLLVVLDGTGRGDQAGLTALLAAAAVLGTQAVRRGVVWPEELLAAIQGASDRFGVRTFASGFVAVVDRQHGELTWSRDAFPAPWLRGGGRASRLTGKRRGEIEVGRVPLADDWLLLVATDGVAHAPTRRERTLWETRDLRQLVARSRTPAELVELLSKRLAVEPAGSADDRLALAVAGKDNG